MLALAPIAVPPAYSAQHTPASTPAGFSGGLDKLIPPVIASLGQVGCKEGSCRILVVNSWLPSGKTCGFCVASADYLSERLPAIARVETIPRTNLQDFLGRERIPSKLLANEKAAVWLARELGADIVLVGEVHGSAKTLELTVQLLRGKKKSPGHKVTWREIPASADLAPAESIAKDSPAPTQADGLPAAERAGKNGVSVPGCVSCPDPSYTGAARDANFQGVVVFDITVPVSGTPSDIQVIKGAPYGLNQAESRAIRSCRLKPALKDGNPVATKVQIEISFRLH